MALVTHKAFNHGRLLPAVAGALVRPCHKPSAFGFNSDDVRFYRDWLTIILEAIQKAASLAAKIQKIMEATCPTQHRRSVNPRFESGCSLLKRLTRDTAPNCAVVVGGF
jgi:hypothetical protein